MDKLNKIKYEHAGHNGGNPNHKQILMAYKRTEIQRSVEEAVAFAWRRIPK